MRRLSLAAVLLVGLAGGVIPLTASASGSPPVGVAQSGDVQKFTLYDGSKVEVGPDGMGWRTDANGGILGRLVRLGRKRARRWAISRGPLAMI